MELDEKQLLLTREASMSSMSLGIGLTNLRRYDFVLQGYFYSGLHSLTIGIERLVKLIILYDYQLRNDGRYPTNAILKSAGHDLVHLISAARAANRHHACAVDDSIFDTDAIIQSVVVFLSDFATQSRYHNLDSLTGRPHRTDEPLRRWDSEICAAIVTRHYRPNPRKEREASAVAEAMESMVAVAFSSESGDPVDTMHAFVTRGLTVSIKQKYSAYYIYSIVRFLSLLLFELEHKGRFYPCLREFFKLFISDEKKWILNKKSWNPLPPYRF